MKNIRTLGVFISAITLLIAFILSACQPTPDEEAIVNKGNGELENKVMQTDIVNENTVQTEDRIVWSETKNVNIDGGDYTVKVNLNARMPEMPESSPVFLIEPKEFSADFMKKTAEYLMNGDIFDGKESKEDVTKELLDFEKGISSHTIRAGYQEQVEEYRDFMNKRYSDAADTNSDAKFEYSDKEYGQKWFHLKSYPSDNSIMEFSSFCGTEGFSFRINNFNKYFCYLNNITGENIQAKDVKTTYTQALETADKAVSTLFKEPFVMAHSDIIDIVNNHEYLWHDGDDTSLGQAYVFYYVREYDGIPSLYIDSAPITVTDDTEYAKPYSREGMAIVVDDRGVAQMYYESYSDTIKTLNNAADLMPFEKILDNFKSGIFYHNLWGFPGSTTQINITRIDYGLVREPVKDNPDQYMMVPAWNFIGNIGNSEIEEISEAGKGTSMLAINAVDGSIITDYEEMVDPK